MHRKYFFFDIDGTLVPEAGGSQIPRSAQEAIAELRRKGHFCAIATGRAECLAADQCKALGFDSMVSDGGYGLTVDGKFLGIMPLPKDLCLKLARQCDEKGCPWAVSWGNEPVRYTTNQGFIDAAGAYYMATRLVERIDMEALPQILKMYVACSPEDQKEITALSRDGRAEYADRAALSAAETGGRAVDAAAGAEGMEACGAGEQKDPAAGQGGDRVMTALPWARYHPAYIFVEPTDKAVGIKRVMDYFHAPYKDVVVFGDALNDRAMFIPEWTSIAMGNAVEELKVCATYVTRAAADDGIAYALRHFGWID